MADKLECKVCGHGARDYLGDHLLEAHDLTVEAYLEAHPGAPTMSQRLADALDAEHAKSNVRRAHPPKPGDLTTTFAGVTFPVYPDVPAEACLPRPPHYREPEYGDLGVDLQHLALALSDTPPPAIFVHGSAGCGKDAAFYEWSGRTHRPAIVRQVVPGADIQSWFFTREFNEKGTFDKEGEVLVALRDGYECPDGTRVPYLFLVTDFDRADRSQAEYLRLITDSIEGRVVGPGGRLFPVLEGTIIAATANSAGGGDVRGRYISANPIDGSILDRFDVALQFHQMEWEDEEPVVHAKFPLLAERAPGVFTVMGRITGTLRKAIKDEELYADYSHRSLCAILKHATRLVRQKPSGIPDDLVRRAARVWVDKLPDEDSRSTAWNIMDPHLKGGALDAGDTSHIKTGAKTLADGFK